MKVNGSKSAFVEACFRNSPGTNPRVINTLWMKGGGNGMISPSLVYKTKHDIRKAASKAAGAPKVIVVAPRPGLPAPATKNNKKAAATDPTTEIWQAICVHLQQRPMDNGEIVTTIQEGDVISPIPRHCPRRPRQIIDEP
jgi:hypothetical protein